MALGHSPRIVTDGMVLYLDAANPKNYNLTEVEVLVVAGGGGGGAGTAGGGGGGGVIYNRNFAVTPGSALTVTVGAGGTGKVYAVSNSAGDNGGNSVFGALTSIGGGGGGNRDTNEVGKNGGSGGGGGGAEGGVNGAGTGTSGQGFAGGTGRGGGGGSAGGGGGGAGEVGQSSPSSGLGGNGGNGLGFDISGTFTYYGGGGGGGSHTGRSSGGIGGGGAGSENGPTYNAVAGTTNTGGGGGGGGGAGGGQFGGNGGSGIVIVRYQGPQKAIGGTITSNNGYTIHTFTTVGSTTFTPLVATNNSAVLGLSDLSGRGNFGTTSNSTTYSSANGGSIVFDGVDDYVSLTTNTIFNFGSNNFSISTWIYPTNLSGVDKCLLEFRGSGNSLDGWVLFINSNNKLQIYDQNLKTQSNTTLTTNTWYNLLIVRVSGTLTYYLNSVSDGSISYSTSTNASSTGVRIGTRQDTTNSFNGRISNTTIYNRALSAAEVQQNYNALASRFAVPPIVTDGLVLNLDAGNSASYPGSGTTWTNLVGGGNNGTLTNGPTYSSANGGSIVFDGTNDYVSITQTLTTPFTITGFIRYTDQSKTSNTFINTNPHTVLGISLNRLGGGEIYVYIGNGSGWQGAPGIISSQNMIVNQWYQVSFTSTGSGSTLYLNEVNVGTSVYSPSGWGSTYYLGTIGFNNEELRGNIATTQIYNRALTAAEVSQNFNATRGRFGI